MYMPSYMVLLRIHFRLSAKPDLVWYVFIIDFVVTGSDKLLQCLKNLLGQEEQRLLASLL